MARIEHAISGGDIILICELKTCSQRVYEVPKDAKYEGPTVLEALAAERDHLKTIHRIDWPKVISDFAKELGDE